MQSRPNKGLIRERFENEKNIVIENGVGKEDSWAKKVGNGTCGVTLDDIEKLLDVLGLKAVDKSKKCVDARVYESYRTLATIALNDPAKLQWDGD